MHRMQQVLREHATISTQGLIGRCETSCHLCSLHQGSSSMVVCLCSPLSSMTKTWSLRTVPHHYNDTTFKKMTKCPTGPAQLPEATCNLFISIRKMEVLRCLGRTDRLSTQDGQQRTTAHHTDNYSLSAATAAASRAWFLLTSVNASREAQGVMTVAIETQHDIR